METKKLIPYSVYLPEKHVSILKELAKERKAASMVRDAVALLIEGNDAFNSGYNKGIKDAAKVVYECPEAQMVSIKGKNMSTFLSGQIKELIF